MEIRKVGVLGCGLMGAGIAQVAASAGFETVVREVSDDLIIKGFGGIEKSLAKFAEKGTITADQQREIRGRLSGTTSFADLAGCALAGHENIRVGHQAIIVTGHAGNNDRFGRRAPAQVVC